MSEMDLMEIGCEDGREMELAHDRLNLWALVLAELNHCVLLPDLLTYLPNCGLYNKNLKPGRCMRYT